MQTTIYSAMAMLTSATSIKHILDDDAEELSCGQVHYALELDGQIFLVWNDMDSSSMIVSPIERWNLANLMEAIDDPMPMLSFSEINGGQVFSRIKGRRGSTLPSTQRTSSIA